MAKRLPWHRLPWNASQARGGADCRDMKEGKRSKAKKPRNGLAGSKRVSGGTQNQLITYKNDFFYN